MHGAGRVNINKIPLYVGIINPLLHSQNAFFPVDGWIYASRIKNSSQVI